MAEPADEVETLAERYFHEGHNCAMAVLRAVAETLQVAHPRCVPAVALGMGGGIGHTDRTCGAVTGAIMALGLAVSRFTEGPLIQKKEEAGTLAAALLNRFLDEFGSVDCRPLLGFSWSDPDARERWEREGHPTCDRYVRWAARETLRIADRLR